MKDYGMTGREIVKRCIEFRDPPRIGLHFRVSPIEGRVWSLTDFAGVALEPDPNFRPAREGASEWGIVMESLAAADENMGESKDPPLGEGWHLLETFRWPDFMHPARWVGMSDKVDALHTAGKYVYGTIPSLMLMPISLRGIENWFMDHGLEKGNLCYLLDRVTEIRIQLIERFAEYGVDGCITYDDMGTNERGLVRPKIFREIYYPRYKRANDALHEHGMHLLHHCCGMVREYMDMLVDGGCDVLQLDQPELMGIEWLGENYGGKLCFWNPCDIQQTLPFGDLKAIEEEAHRQVWHLGNYGGGFMVKAYQQPNSIKMSVASSEAQYQAFLKYGEYPLIPPTMA